MLLYKSTINQMRKAMDRGETTSREIILTYLKRIAEIDSCKGGLNSVVELNPDALSISESLDMERNQGKVRSNLHGIPVMLKDNINTADKMHTTAGSIALKNNFAPYDASLVENLRNAGAVILAKTNLTEFANYMAKDMPNGYSSRGGQVLSPYDAKSDPSGSSTGSAVAVSAGLTAVSIGTETDGSILSPSRTNGIVGMKPTKGLIPTKGIIPISNTLDTAGPMANCVEDAAILLEAMTGKKQEYLKGIRSFSFIGTRVGLNTAYIKYISKDRLSTLNNILRVLKNAGAIIVEDIDMRFNKELGNIMTYEFKHCLNHYLSTLNSGFPIKTLDDIIEYNKINNTKALKYGQDKLINAKYKTSERMLEPAYLKAIIERQKTIDMIDRIMDLHNVDIIIDANIYHSLSAYAGFPSMTIPTGLGSDGIPTGTLLMTRRYDESTLIKFAYALEQAMNVNVFPELK